VRKTEILLPHFLFADLTRNGTIPLYQQVASKVEAAIRQEPCHLARELKTKCPLRIA